MCSDKFINGCPLTTTVRSWLQKFRNKIRTNKTRFGMVSENLSTDVYKYSGKDDNAGPRDQNTTRPRSQRRKV